MVLYYLTPFIMVEGRGLLLFSFLLFRTRYVRYLMAFWCIFFMRVLILVFGIFRLISWSMECLRIAPLTPAVNSFVH